jgi:putative Holliday junction resolvase
MPITNSVLGLDVGEKRVGVAVASLEARLPRPLATLSRDDNFFAALQEIIDNNGATALVVGLPRNLEGESTRQTADVEDFVTQLIQHSKLPLQLVDEAVTSKKAEAELDAKGKPYVKGDIDSLAATYILDDYFKEGLA